MSNPDVQTEEKLAEMDESGSAMRILADSQGLEPSTRLGRDEPYLYLNILNCSMLQRIGRIHLDLRSVILGAFGPVIPVET